jgi:2'-5' RNA ligase
LFFALWPARAEQASLAQMTRNVVVAAGGRPVPPENFHVTLAFLGSVPEARLSQVEAIGREVANEVGGAPVQVTFDAIEYWKKPKLICATARPAAAGTASGDALAGGASGAELAEGSHGEVLGGAASAAALAGALKSQLTAAGFTPDLKPFRAHVTLARKVPHGTHDGTMQSVRWACPDFALVDSRTGPGAALYSVLKSWPLCTEVRKMPEKKHK